MRTEGIVKLLCSLVNTANLQEDLLSQITDCLTMLTENNIDNCEELWWEKGVSFLGEQLEVNELIDRSLVFRNCHPIALSRTHPACLC